MKGDFTRSTFRPERHYTGVRMQQGRVQLDADWNEQLDILAYFERLCETDIIGPCGAPKVGGGFEVKASEDGTDVQVSAGRLYVDGVLCENEQQVSLTAQPDLPGYALPTEPGLYVAYLDAWSHHVTALEDPWIAEVALGGPDTCTRLRRLAQARLQRYAEADATPDCSLFGPDWAPASVNRGMMRAQAKATAEATDPCILPPEAGYRRLENLLYRVEIHQGSQGGAPTFKWSRDNGSVAAAVAKIEGSTLTVVPFGESNGLGFAGARWVELSNRGRALRNEPGIVVELASVQGRELVVKEWPGGTPLKLEDLETQPTARRWDSPPLEVTSGGFIELESGVQVEFQGLEYQSGDYWMIPARVALGSVLWPIGPDNQPVFASPHGIQHHYCALGILRLKDSKWTTERDCRTIFRPLTSPREDEDGVRIQRVAVGETELRNDTELQADSLVGGLRVECDQAVDPETLGQRPVCAVTIDVPFASANAMVGYQRVVVAAEVRADEKAIVWTPQPDSHEWLKTSLFAQPDPNRQNRILANLSLKGNFIWTLSEPRQYLDGEVFGFRREGAGNTELLLPTGDRRRGGDFEMWFWLTKRSVPVISVTPGRLDFGEVRMSTAKDITLTVQNTGTADLVISRLQITTGGENFAIVGAPAAQTIKPGKETQVTVRFEPKAPAPPPPRPPAPPRVEGVVAPALGVGIMPARFEVLAALEPRFFVLGQDTRVGKLTIESNDAARSPLVIDLVGKALAVPVFAAEPSPVVFPNTFVGGQANAQLRILNKGQGQLEVVDMIVRSPAGAQFFFVDAAGRTVDRLPGAVAIGANGQHVVNVRFTPGAVGDHRGQVVISYTDPDRKQETIPLIGKGLSRPVIDLPVRPVRPVIPVIRGPFRGPGR